MYTISWQGFQARPNTAVSQVKVKINLQIVNIKFFCDSFTELEIYKAGVLLRISFFVVCISLSWSRMSYKKPSSYFLVNAA